MHLTPAFEMAHPFGGRIELKRRVLAVEQSRVGPFRHHPELRDRLWVNIRMLRNGLREIGYAIGQHESPIVPILTGEEARTVVLWQTLLRAGLYVNVIVPPGCPKDDCVLRASCSAAHSPEQIVRALQIFASVKSVDATATSPIDTTEQFA